MKMDKKIIALLAFFTIGGIASAALVNVISNTITATVTTKAPLEIKFVEVSDGLEIVNNNTVTGQVYAGSTIWYNVTTTNHANNPIERYPVTIVSSDQGLSAGLYEIEQVIFADSNYPAGFNITNLLYCVNPDGSLTQLRSCPAKGANEPIELFFDNDGNGVAQPYIINAGATVWNKITVKLSPAVGNQTITLRYEEHFALP
jgi:hypothetical protein